MATQNRYKNTVIHWRVAESEWKVGHRVALTGWPRHDLEGRSREALVKQSPPGQLTGNTCLKYRQPSGR